MTDIRTLQWRWTLGREKDIQKYHNTIHDPKYMREKTHIVPTAPLGVTNPAYETPNFLYDIGKGENVTAFSQKQARENWYQATRDTSKPR